MTRQAVSAIESDLYLPSTAVALRLTGVLSCRVEDLFTPAASEKPQMGVGGGLAYNPGINTSTDNAFVGIDLANPNLRRQLATFGNGRRLGGESSTTRRTGSIASSSTEALERTVNPSGLVPLDAVGGTLVENAIRVQLQIFF